ncbi:hypothetical protein KDL44_08330 [bacterium]|nr:hypothetical protein [bacterium]
MHKDDSGKQQYRHRLRPVSAEEFEAARRELPEISITPPRSPALPATARQSDRAACIAELENRAAGKMRSSAKWQFLLFIPMLMSFLLDLQRGELQHWKENLLKTWPFILAIIAMTGLQFWIIRARQQAAPDTARVFREQALANLREGGLLWEVLQARERHGILPPEEASILTRELISSNRPLKTELARIELLVDNYIGICERRGLAWHGPLSTTELSQLDELRRQSLKENSAVQRLLYRLIAAELRRGNY